MLSLIITILLIIILSPIILIAGLVITGIASIFALIGKLFGIKAEITIKKD